ncbi:MAG: hypothetical protein AB7G35_23560 [Hyphomicrobiaceae bacterium]
MIKHLKRVAILATVLALPAGVALAQGGPPWGWGGWFHFFPFLIVLAFVTGLVLIMVRLIGRHCPWRDSRERTSVPHKAGLDILDERLARGEIEKAEYEEKRRLIVSA